MTRGIHLKRLSTVDLELLGLADESTEQNQPQGLLAEADPVLCGLIAEVRGELEGTLSLLTQALAAADAEQAATPQPPPPKTTPHA